MTNLDARIEKGLRDAHDALAQRGDLPSVAELQGGYARFRERFCGDSARLTSPVPDIFYCV
jgi:hypothetical protein